MVCYIDLICLNIVTKQFENRLYLHFLFLFRKSNTKSNNNKIQNRYITPSKILSSIIFEIGDFTLKLLKNNKNNFTLKHYIFYVTLGSKRETKYITLTFSQ